MFRWIKAWLFSGSSRDRAPTSTGVVTEDGAQVRAALLLNALARRSEALREAQFAKRRRDDRGYGRAMMEARQATTDLLRAEAGR